MGTRPEKLPAPRRPKPAEHEALLRVEWIDELFTAIDTRRR